MTWKERRTITILSIILAVLSAALLIVLGIKYREARAAKETPETEDAGIVAQPSEFVSLKYSNGITTLSFIRNEADAWVWADDTSFPLDDATITSILDTLTTMVPQQTLSAPDSLEEYDLDDPAATITAATSDEKTFKASFGKTTTDGNSYYTLLNDDDSTIYIFSDALFQLMKVPIYDMMTLPKLPELNGTNLLSITILGPTGDEGESIPVVLTAVRPEEEENSEATWRHDGANVTDDKTVQALLEDLSTMTIVRCVDYRPSEEAASLCGFDSPDAKVAVRYRTGKDADQILLITIGDPLPDGSGRYARIGQDDTIYLLPTAALDPLMRVAVNGLE